MRGLVVCFVGGEGEVQGLGWFGEEGSEGDSASRDRKRSVSLMFSTSVYSSDRASRKR